MGRNAQRRREARDHRRVLDGSTVEALKFAASHRWEMVAAIQAKFPGTSLEAANRKLEELLGEVRRAPVGLGARLKAMLLGLVTAAGLMPRRAAR